METNIQQQVTQNRNTEQVKKSREKIIMIALIVILAVIGVIALCILFSTLGSRVKYQGEAWYQGTRSEQSPDLAETLSKVTPFDAVGTVGSSSLAESWTYGNDMQLYARSAELAMDEDYYYVGSKPDQFKLYRISRDGKFTREKLADAAVDMLSVGNGKIYYANKFSNVSDKPGIYCINIDGTQPELLADVSPGALILVNDWLYYLNLNDRHIYKLNTTDRREIRLTEQLCVSMTINENRIYYTYQSDEEDDSKYILASMDVDGNGYYELSGGGRYSDIMFVDGRIYYVDYAGEYFGSIDPDGTEQRIIAWAPIKSGIQISDGNYYYIDGAYNSGVAVYQESTDSRQYYNIEDVKYFYIFDGMIYINYMDGTDEKVSVHNLEDGTLVPFFE